MDVDSCIVKLSQPHIHRATGLMFKLDDSIVTACKLRPTACTSNVRVWKNRVVGCQDTQQDVKKARSRKPTVPSDVEPDSSSDTDATVEQDYGSDAEYRLKKKISSDIFKYFMHTTLQQQVDMQVDISEAVQLHWKHLEAKRTV